MPVPPNTEATQTVAASKLPELPPSYLGDENALNLLPVLAVERLLDNGRRIAMTGNDNLEPVVKLFTPDVGRTRLLVSLDPDEPDIAYGLCDLGLGYAEIGSVSIAAIKSVRGAIGLPQLGNDLFRLVPLPGHSWSSPAGQNPYFGTDPVSGGRPD